MTTTVYAIGNFEDIPGRLASFGQSVGWSTSVDGNIATLQRAIPNSDHPDFGLTLADIPLWRVKPFTVVGNIPLGIKALKALYITSSLMGQDPTPNSRPNPPTRSPSNMQVAQTGGALTNNTDEFVWLPMPRYNGRQMLPDMPNPTKLHCFGNGDFIGAVIEFGFNQFRHMYFGSLDKIGSYSGGDCVAVTDNMPVSSPNSYGGGQGSGTSVLQVDQVRNLFRSVATDFSSEDGYRYGKSAGIYVGPNMDGPAWRRFDMGSFVSGTVGAFVPRTAFGGWGDKIDDLLLSHGFADFSGEQLLFPINLFTNFLTGVDAVHRPLGSVRGVRNVNMKNLEPGQLVEVGNRLWRCFPTLTKSTQERVVLGPPAGTGAVWDDVYSRWPAYDTSLYFGHAYLEGDA